MHYWIYKVVFTLLFIFRSIQHWKLLKYYIYYEINMGRFDMIFLKADNESDKMKSFFSTIVSVYH